MSDAPQPSEKSGCGPSFTTIAVVCLLLFLGFMLLYPAVNGGDVPPRAQCKHHLHNLVISLHNYHETHEHLPPAFLPDDRGLPRHSWRVMLLPFMEQNNRFRGYDFTESWGGPSNRRLENPMPPDYRCPSHEAGAANLTTDYVAVVGPETMWPGAEGGRFGDVADGLSNTLLLVEMADSGIHWMEPRDAPFDAMSFRVGDTTRASIRSFHGDPGGWFRKPNYDGANVAMGDGVVRYISSDVDPDVVRQLLHRNDDGPFGEW